MKYWFKSIRRFTSSFKYEVSTIYRHFTDYEALNRSIGQVLLGLIDNGTLYACVAK